MGSVFPDIHSKTDKCMLMLLSYFCSVEGRQSFDLGNDEIADGRVTHLLRFLCQGVILHSQVVNTLQLVELIDNFPLKKKRINHIEGWRMEMEDGD